MIESIWCALKKSLPRYDTNKDLYNSYFAEYCIRRKFLISSGDKFLHFLKLIPRVYHLPTEAAKPAQPELLATPPLAEAAAGAVGVRNFEVGNFNLNFDFDLDDEEAEEEQDTSADLFE